MLGDQAGIVTGLHLVQHSKLRVGQSLRLWPRPRIDGKALLAAGDAEPLLVGATVAVPLRAAFEERSVEGAAMNAFGFRQRAVNIEDESAGARDALLEADG